MTTLVVLTQDPSLIKIKPPPVTFHDQDWSWITSLKFFMTSTTKKLTRHNSYSLLNPFSGNLIFLIFETFKCRKKTMSKMGPFKTSENPWSNAMRNALGNALGNSLGNAQSSLFKRIKNSFPTRFSMPFLKSRDQMGLDTSVNIYFSTRNTIKGKIRCFCIQF